MNPSTKKKTSKRNVPTLNKHTTTSSLLVALCRWSTPRKKATRLLLGLEAQAQRSAGHSAERTAEHEHGGGEAEAGSAGSVRLSSGMQRAKARSASGRSRSSSGRKSSSSRSKNGLKEDTIAAGKVFLELQSISKVGPPTEVV